MSKTLLHKTILIFGTFICLAGLIVATGCSSNQKKRGIVFRGDWAFEINRTPWVGHPGNTDIPGEENGENSANKQPKSLCTKNQKSSLSDSLLGPLTSLKSKCRCKDCMAARGNNESNGSNGGNINITSYNPTIANTFPSPMPGSYPGAVSQGSLSLPPRAIVVPAGVLMPNGTLLPHYLFYSQPYSTTMAGNPGVNQGNPKAGQSGLQTSDLRLQDGTSGGIPGTGSPMSEGIPSVQPQQIQSPPMQTPASAPPQPSTSGDTMATQSQMLQVPMLQGPMPPGYPSQGQYAGSPQLVVPETQNAMLQNGMTPIAVMANTMMQDAMTQDAIVRNTMAPNAVSQNALVQSLNPANPMMINPAYSQVVPGMSMTGTQAPGYPPIGYAPSGYSMGYAQQVNTPTIVGPMGTQPNQPHSLAAGVSSESRGASDEELAASNTRQAPLAAQMPYPRHFPVPTRPVYQRNMGMAPGYAAVRPPMSSPNMMQPPAFQGMTPQTPINRQISQAAALQEQQMMLERQRQALIMQQNASVAQSASRQSGKSAGKSVPAFLRQVPEIAEDDDDNVAPLPPTSKILLANHQTPILQTPSPRVSQVTQTNPTQSPKKVR